MKQENNYIKCNHFGFVINNLSVLLLVMKILQIHVRREREICVWNYDQIYE